MTAFWVLVGLWAISEIAAIAFYLWFFGVWFRGPSKD